MNEQEIKKPHGIPHYKNLAGALLFSVILGPIGLLYSSSLGGIIMIILGFVVACNKLPFLFIVVWLSSCIWSVIATNHHNKKISISDKN